MDIHPWGNEIPVQCPECHTLCPWGPKSKKKSTIIFLCTMPSCSKSLHFETPKNKVSWNWLGPAITWSLGLPSLTRCGILPALESLALQVSLSCLAYRESRWVLASLIWAIVSRETENQRAAYHRFMVCWLMVYPWSPSNGNRHILFLICVDIQWVFLIAFICWHVCGLEIEIENWALDVWVCLWLYLLATSKFLYPKVKIVVELRQHTYHNFPLLSTALRSCLLFFLREPNFGLNVFC